MAEEPQDISTMTPAEATSKLAELTAAYRGPEPTATPSTPAEAAARLRQLTENPSWREGYLNGTVAMRREFSVLTELAASGDQAPDLSIETVDAVSDPSALSKAAYAGLVDALRAGGLPDDAEQYIRDLDSGKRTDRPTAGDGAAAQAALNRLTKDPAFGKRYLTGEIAATNLVNTLNRVIAYAADDGQPVSAPVAQRLAALGLR